MFLTYYYTIAIGLAPQHNRYINVAMLQMWISNSFAYNSTYLQGNVPLAVVIVGGN